VNCPFCRISSMRSVPSSAGVGIDRCQSCGTAWFDFGEIRELTEGRFAETEEPSSGVAAPGGSVSGPRDRMSRAWREARALSCPKCSSGLYAADFQSTGIPVFRCAGCGGILVPRSVVGDLSAKMRFHRDHASLYQALGESLAGEVRGRLDREMGPDLGANAPGEVPTPGLPILVPLRDDAPSSGALPLATLGLLGLTITLHFLSTIGAGGLGEMPSRVALPSGAGFDGVPKLVLWLAPFFHGGMVPLGAGCLFLFVLGDNVEDRMGSVKFLLFYLFCGAVAGAAHALWGTAGAPAALGSAGAVAGVLGAYLVFFPDVPISMYGMGKVVAVPAYLFACAWAVAVFLWGWGPGPLSDLLNPAPYTLPGHLAGFGAGAGAAVLCRSFE